MIGREPYDREIKKSDINTNNNKGDHTYMEKYCRMTSGCLIKKTR